MLVFVIFEHYYCYHHFIIIATPPPPNADVDVALFRFCLCARVLEGKLHWQPTYCVGKYHFEVMMSNVCLNKTIINHPRVDALLGFD